MQIKMKVKTMIPEPKEDSFVEESIKDTEPKVEEQIVISSESQK